MESLVFRGAHTGVILDCDGLRIEAEVANHRGEPPEWLTTGSVVQSRMSPSALRALRVVSGAPAFRTARAP